MLRTAPSLPMETRLRTVPSQQIQRRKPKVSTVLESLIHSLACLSIYSLTLPITFQFQLFFHSANASINLNFDPTNINITQVEQTFITLERRPASRRKSVVDSQVEGWAKWAMMNKTLYGNSKKTAAIREMFGNTTRYEKLLLYLLQLVLSVSKPIFLALPTYRFLPCRYQGQVCKNVESTSGLRKMQICSSRSSSSSESTTCLQGWNSRPLCDEHGKQWYRFWIRQSQ